jgi:hypothetical protein
MWLFIATIDLGKTHLKRRQEVELENEDDNNNFVYFLATSSYNARRVSYQRTAAMTPAYPELETVR